MSLLSIVIPARNEQQSIADAIDAVLAQDVPHSTLEVVVVDGGSTDDTARIAKEALHRSDLARWDVISNPVGTTPSNLNAGLRWADGDVLIRVDARSVIPADYARRMAAVLDDPSIAVVGGHQCASVTSTASDMHRGIARALENPFVNGGSRYRNHRADSGPCDTAYLGVFRTEQLRSIGGWSEEFTSNQDFDLAQRMQSFGTIWYEAGLPVRYRPRSTHRDLLRQYRRFGAWKARYWNWTGDRPTARQVVLLAAPPLAAGVGLAALIRMPGRAALLLASAVAGLFVIDAAGSHDDAPIRSRLHAVVAMVVIGGGWWSGCAQERLRTAEDRKGGEGHGSRE